MMLESRTYIHTLHTLHPHNNLRFRRPIFILCGFPFFFLTQNPLPRFAREGGVKSS